MSTAVRGRYGRTRAPHASVRARARMRSGADASAPQRAGAFRSASTAGGFGAQAFYSASAFNANIGAWNTASVTTLYQVCAAFGPGGAPPWAAAC